MSYKVAIIGGAVSGAEAAHGLAEAGIQVCVFEQNRGPYGKIKEGLPIWHEKLRKTEFGHIDKYLDQSSVHYVPLTKIGKDVSFDDLMDDWGFDLIILANGAWDDRPLALEGISDYVGKGLYYQNPFFQWFNSSGDPGHNEFEYNLADKGLIIGGGLASIDVAKALMIESVRKGLKQKKIEVSRTEVGHMGCQKVLEKNGLVFEELGIEPCTLFYRRQIQDMPLASFKENATDEEKEKTRKTRERLLDVAQKKFYFKVQPQCRPTGYMTVKTKINGGNVEDEPGSEFEVKSPLVISSIGSIPQPIKGIPQRKELYTWKDLEKGTLDKEGNTPVYGVGNVVTGKGNILVSRKHSQKIIKYILDDILPGLGKSKVDANSANSIDSKVKDRQSQVGYDGNYASWMRKS
jgi:ferredoxin/flavodoxin---NADP+ reductase